MSSRRLSKNATVFSSALSWQYNQSLENVAIANALQLEAARRRAVAIRFNFVARARFELARSAYPLPSYSVFTADTLWPCTLTPWPDLWLLTLNIGSVPPEPFLVFWAKSDNPRRSYCSSSIWPYDLEHVSRVTFMDAESFFVGLRLRLQDLLCDKLTVMGN